MIFLKWYDEERVLFLAFYLGTFSVLKLVVVFSFTWNAMDKVLKK